MKKRYGLGFVVLLYLAVVFLPPPWLPFPFRYRWMSGVVFDTWTGRVFQPNGVDEYKSSFFPKPSISIAPVSKLELEWNQVLEDPEYVQMPRAKKNEYARFFIKNYVKKNLVDPDLVKDFLKKNIKDEGLNP